MIAQDDAAFAVEIDTAVAKMNTPAQTFAQTISVETYIHLMVQSTTDSNIDDALGHQLFQREVRLAICRYWRGKWHRRLS